MARDRGTVNPADPNVRRRVWERAGGICGFCGDPVTVNWMDIDHQQPRAQGGQDVESNLRPAHRNCDRSAGSKVRSWPGSRTPDALVGVQLRLPTPVLAAVKQRARRELRSMNAEVLILLEWALRHMPEQLQDSPPPLPS